MPVFEESSHRDRDQRIHRPRPPPLPRLTPAPENIGDKHGNYEVVVVGAGPAGLFLTMCLSRLGLTDDSLLCIDAKSGTLKAGQADGLQPRTLEVFKSLGILSEIYDDGCHMSEVAFWNPKADGMKGIERTTFAPDVAVRARYQHEITIHQGRIERILEEELSHSSSRRVVRSTKFIDYEIDDQDSEFPIVSTIEQAQSDGTTIHRKIRSKYLVGADGAHSRVRQAMKVPLEGENMDHIWGVCDFVADTDFPDIRKRSAVHSSAGSIMVIPRERISSGDYLTRLYVQVKDDIALPPQDVVHSEDEAQRLKDSYKERRQAVTAERIFEQANSVLAPYSIRIKEGTEVDWCAAYQIGQRVALRFALGDSHGDPRVFIVGDACHTHSPKAGQGMNVSMMDSYNLAWKLIHTIHGLTPTLKDDTDTVLASYESERLKIAQQLIDFDRKFSSLFSGQIQASANSINDLTHDKFLQVFSEGNGFTSGCGIEYPISNLVAAADPDQPSPIHHGNPLDGVIKVGQRLADVRVRRFADANIRHLQDDLYFNGRYRIIIFGSNDIFTPDGLTGKALDHVTQTVLPKFPPSMLELIVLHPSRLDRFEWTDVAPLIKKHAEMTFHGPSAGDNVYDIYGIDPGHGAMVVVRPDGYVGQVVSLGTADISSYLSRCLVAAEGK